MDTSSTLPKWPYTGYDAIDPPLEDGKIGTVVTIVTNSGRCIAREKSVHIPASRKARNMHLQILQWLREIATKEQVRHVCSHEQRLIAKAIWLSYHASKRMGLQNAVALDIVPWQDNEGSDVLQITFPYEAWLDDWYEFVDDFSYPDLIVSPPGEL